MNPGEAFDLQNSNLDGAVVRGASKPLHQFTALDARDVPSEAAKQLGQNSGMDVIFQKRYWDRPAQSARLRDGVAEVVNLRRSGLGLNYLADWAVQLGVRDTLQLILDGKLKLKTT